MMVLIVDTMERKMRAMLEQSLMVNKSVWVVVKMVLKEVVNGRLLKSLLLVDRRDGVILREFVRRRRID